MSKCLLIINPVAGKGKAKRFAMGLQWELSNLYDHLELKFTRKENDATFFAQEATEEGYDAVFCMGGDGTVNETVNGIMRGGATSTFGFVPVGTVNDLARALKIPLQPKLAIKMLADAAIKKVDIGRCNDQYFCNNIAIGSLPTAVEEVTSKEKALLGPLAYFVRGGQVLFHMEQENYVITLPKENRTVHVRTPLVIALLTKCISSFEKFMPMAEVNDGYMRIVIFRENLSKDILQIMPLILNGSMYNSKYVTILKTQEAYIEHKNDKKMTTNMDGSRGPLLPLTMEVFPSALEVFVPSKGFDESRVYTHSNSIKF